MHIIHSVKELKEHLSNIKGRVGLVPTMGNLHAGHLSLLNIARQHSDIVVATIFVNPLQFGPDEDFDAYPRTLDADAAALQQAGVDIVFAPQATDILKGDAQQRITLKADERFAQLEGTHRQGHFDGVLTIVLCLFNLIRPAVAVFGEKDYQQLQLIRSMVEDLHVPVTVLGGATHRAEDGLALSSRNQYLTAGERQVAPNLNRQLRQLVAALEAGRRDYAALEAETTKALSNFGFVVDYVAIRARDLSMPKPDENHFRVLATATLGKTRLLDNLPADVVEMP